MCELSNLDSKQIKNKLAVFEQVPCKERQYTERGQSFRKLFKAALSPASDLVIDDDDDDDYSLMPPQKKRNKGVRLLEEPLQLCCLWNDCKTVFQKFKDFILHIEQHIMCLNVKEQSEFYCKWGDCSYTTLSLSLLNQHACFHGYHAKLKNIGDNVVERIKLPKCNQPDEFVIPEDVNGYQCGWVDCGARYLTVFDFYEHIKLHINSNPKYCKEGETVTCCWRGCIYKFSTQYKLADHLRSHTKERIVACSTCGNMFATKTKFYDHRKRQLPIEMQRYQCSQCSKLFPSERLLRDHMRSHINHYKCTMCDMTCPKPSALATHIRYRHLSERPLKCHLCDHSCVSKQGLQSHLFTHRVEKLMACEICDYRCRSLYGLYSHCQSIHGQAWTPTYECHCCQKTFSRGNQLTKHLIKEHDFQWPSGHSRFRYKEDTDGIFRLQTVRYESIEVTQEMMRTNSNSETVKANSNIAKYNLRKRQQVKDRTDNYLLMIAENGEQNLACPTENNIVITINDVDERGNIVNSEILRSNEMKVMKTSSSVKDERNLRTRKTK